MGEVRVEVRGDELIVDVDIPADETGPDALARFAASCWLQGRPVEYRIPEDRARRSKFAAAMRRAGFALDQDRTNAEVAAWTPSEEGDAVVEERRRIMRSKRAVPALMWRR